MERLLPSNFGKVGRPFRPWQTVWKRHRKFADDGTWDRALAQLMAEADVAGPIDWTVSVDSTVNRAHQHRDEHDPPRAGHRGLRRITRNSPAAPILNLQVTASGGPAVG